MQRFAGLNSIEGWNLTLQLSKIAQQDFDMAKMVDFLT